MVLACGSSRVVRVSGEIPSNPPWTTSLILLNPSMRSSELFMPSFHTSVVELVQAAPIVGLRPSSVAAPCSSPMPVPGAGPGGPQLGVWPVLLNEFLVRSVLDDPPARHHHHPICQGGLGESVRD